MKFDEASQIMNEGIRKAKAFLRIGIDSPKGTPLHEEMKQAALEALSWADDDEVIDALCEADRREDDYGT